ncbi:MAG TPA: GTP-binding protein [Phycisphaerae bacterium]|nr:GTP-binding protein [Phycisphaerae bacterium]HRR86432.1 GTP-binding protein [Phycisphaerae bacterium]
MSLITGFLGSGKTSLLQHIVETNPHRRFVYVVNDCGAIDIDGRILQLGHNRLVNIPGGSIFCRCVAGEFVDWLTKIPKQWPEAGGPIEGVVIEASGIADPKVIQQMLRETGLDRVYDLRMIIAVVDPGSFLKLIHILPNIVAQIEASQVILVNKTDIYDENRIRETEGEIRTMNAAARIVRTQHGRVELDVFAKTPVRTLEGRYARCLDPNYSVTTAAVNGTVDPERLAADLRTLGDRVYRVKGFVLSSAGWIYVDLAAGRLTTRPAPTTGPATLVFISSPQAQPAVDRIVTGLRTGAYEAQPRT